MQRKIKQINKLKPYDYLDLGCSSFQKLIKYNLLTHHLELIIFIKFN